MEHTTPPKTLRYIGKIYEASKEEKLKPELFDKLATELAFLSDYLKITSTQAFFTAVIFAHTNKKGGEVALEDLIDYFNCNPMKLLEYNPDLDKLSSLGIVEKRKVGMQLGFIRINYKIKINDQVAEAMVKTKPIPDVSDKGIQTVIDFLEKIYKLGTQRNEEEIRTFYLFRLTKQLILDNLHFPLVKKIQRFGLDTPENYLFFYLIWKTVSGSEQTLVSTALEGIYENPSKRIEYGQNLLSGKNPLVQKDWIEIVEAGFFSDAEMKLTQKSLDLLEEHDITLFNGKQKRDNVISPEDIVPKKLIFNSEEKDRLIFLENMLTQKTFQKTQKRLTKKGLPKGVTALLHGVPGTGKTETVKQLAKTTDRELMTVDISQSKSKWFGESEKVIKKIFTDYQSFAKKCDRTPILLFNEADAIISTRKNSNGSNVAQTENAIQNILLEEFENFEGILVATTNLVINLDTAFERRFLFKIAFSKPDPSTKAKIWQLKLPKLSELECNYLGREFDLSGGEIDNIVRKNEINEIITGKPLDFHTILNFCNSEKLNKNQSKIGFMHSYLKSQK